MPDGRCTRAISWRARTDERRLLMAPSICAAMPLRRGVRGNVRSSGGSLASAGAPRGRICDAAPRVAGEVFGRRPGVLDLRVGTQRREIALAAGACSRLLPSASVALCRPFTGSDLFDGGSADFGAGAAAASCGGEGAEPGVAAGAAAGGAALQTEPGRRCRSRSRRLRQRHSLARRRHTPDARQCEHLVGRIGASGFSPQNFRRWMPPAGARRLLRAGAAPATAASMVPPFAAVRRRADAVSMTISAGLP
jgi:hypothetical protein